MGFGDLKMKAGLQTLNKYLADKSYIEGFQPSQSDVVVFEAIDSAPPADLANALRWYNHIVSYDSEKSSFGGDRKPLATYGSSTVAQPTNADDDDDDDDDEDLFGSDTEEQKEAAAKLKQERLSAYQEKKAKKPATIAKSTLLLDIKPWDDETDMAKMEEHVRTINADGLLWGASKLQPLAYGIKILQISCVIEDDKITTDFLEEEICKFDDYIQSMDVAAFNKI